MDGMREKDKIAGMLGGGLDSRRHGHDHDHEEHDHDHDLSETPVETRPLDLAAVRAKLATKNGKQYWRTLEELSEDPQFEELLHREFPRHASEWDDSGRLDRRSRPWPVLY